MITVLIDDRRSFVDGRACIVLRTLSEALEFMKSDPGRIDELWLDHDLGWDDLLGTLADIMPLITVLEEASFNGHPYDIGTIYVHTANPPAQMTMSSALGRYGYCVITVNADWNGILMDMDMLAAMNERSLR